MVQSLTKVSYSDIHLIFGKDSLPCTLHSPFETLQNILQQLQAASKVPRALVISVQGNICVLPGISQTFLSNQEYCFRLKARAALALSLCLLSMSHCFIHLVSHTPSIFEVGPGLVQAGLVLLGSS